MIGKTVSHYRILEKLGEGGMGVVYKASDTRLDRIVALKFLSPRVVSDGESRERFTREAKAAAALDHPNVCTVFEIGEWNGQAFLAMAFIEGQTVKDKIRQRPLKLSEAIDITLQVARGLRAAHDKGIVHRDVKPANVMVNRQGQARIMDFGLARFVEATRLTQDGSRLGTPAYMAPEQAQGRTADHRADLWALGVMFYEMLTGLRPFDADRPEAMLSAILSTEPEPVTALRAGLPTQLDWIIGKCLAKDAAARYQHAGDLIVDLETLIRKLDPGSTVTLAPAPAAVQQWRRLAPWLGAALFVVALLYYIPRALHWPPASSPGRTIKFAFTPQGLLRGGAGNIDAEVSISRDGKHITYVESAGRQLWVRDIDQEQARPVPGATNVYQAFWSPDSQWIGYSAGTGPDLMKIPAQGGTPVLVAKMAGMFKRAWWSSDGETIVYCDATGLYTVPARGGQPSRVIEHVHIEHPSILELPGGRRAFLYQVLEKGPSHDIYVQVEGESRRLFIATSASSNPYPAYSPSGHILYVDGFGDSTSIWALPFSLKNLRPEGKAFPIAQRASSPMVSATGTLVYSDAATDLVDLVWYDRSGKRLGSIGGRQLAASPALSPDGRRLAAWVREGGPSIVVFDLERQVRSRVTQESRIRRFVSWSPSGKEILYAANRGASSDLYATSATGSGDARQLVGSPAEEHSPALSSDGRYLLYVESSPRTKQDLIYRQRFEDGTFGEPTAFLRTPFNESGAVFSPDGRHVAYLSDESGQRHAYVREFPSGENRIQVSADRAFCVRWAASGREIFYTERGNMMAVPVTSPPGFSVGQPAILFPRPASSTVGEFDVTRDGKRFIVEEGLSDEKPLAVHVVHNWFEEFRGREPR